MSRTTENLQRLRASGLSQMDVSRRTKIPQHSLSRWAAGRVPSSADAALALQDLADQVAPATAQAEPGAGQVGQGGGVEHGASVAVPACGGNVQSIGGRS